MLPLPWLAVSALLGPPSVPAPAVVGVHVRWQAPAACPEAAVIEAQIVRLADVQLADPDRAAAQIVALVTATDAGFAAEVTVHDPDTSTSRHLEADDCMLLGRAVGLVAAVALDPVKTATRLAAESSPPPTPALPAPTPVPEPKPPPPAVDAETSPPDVVPPRADAPPGPPARPRPPLEAGARLGLGVGGLILPGAGVGLSAAPFVGIPRFHAELALQYWAPRRESLGGDVDAGASFQLVGAGLRGCPNLAFGRWRFVPCVGVDAGAFIGTGRGVDVRRADSVASLWVAAIFGVGAEVTLRPRLGLFAAFEGAVSLSRPEFHLDLPTGPASLHQAGRFGPRGLVGVVVHMPRTIP